MTDFFPSWFCFTDSFEAEKSKRLLRVQKCEISLVNVMVKCKVHVVISG